MIALTDGNHREVLENGVQYGPVAIEPVKHFCKGDGAVIWLFGCQRKGTLLLGV